MTQHAGHEASEAPASSAPQAVRLRSGMEEPAGTVLDLQRRCGNRAVGRMLAARRGPPPARRLARLRIQLGAVTVDVDYAGLDAVTDRAGEIGVRYSTFVGSPPPAAVTASVAALSSTAQRWVLYGLSVLQRNAAAASSLNRADAVARLIARAPAATTDPTTGGHDFEDEVIRVSGWAESALTGRLTAPAGTDVTTIQALYNPPVSSGTLDTALLKRELPPALKARLESLDPDTWTRVGTVQLSRLQPIADEIQAEARSFFAPYADAAMANPYAAGWQYSKKLFSVAQMVPNRNERLNYLLNRAEIVGRDTTTGPSIFERASFDSRRHRANLLAVVEPMEATPAIQALVDRLIKVTGRTEHVPELRVGISTRWDLDVAGECDMRWKNIQTMSHEVGHALVHPAFPARAASVRFGQIIREGFTEVLGIQLYRHLRDKAGTDAAFKARMEAGVGGAPCPEPPFGTIGYGQAGPSAEAIRATVGDDNFRAAYFLGAVNLVGL